MRLDPFGPNDAAAIAELGVRRFLDEHPETDETVEAWLEKAEEIYAANDIQALSAFVFALVDREKYLTPELRTALSLVLNRIHFEGREGLLTDEERAYFRALLDGVHRAF